ncbi:RRM1_TatSF1_like and RRM2_TatSF1_like domain-containing protein barc isoform X2 [Haematobia irritans]
MMSDETLGHDKQETIKDESNIERDSSQTSDNSETGQTLKVNVNTCQKPVTKPKDEVLNAVIEKEEVENIKQSAKEMITKEEISAGTDVTKVESTNNIDNIVNIKEVETPPPTGKKDDILTLQTNVDGQSSSVLEVDVGDGKTSSTQNDDGKAEGDLISEKEEQLVPKTNNVTQSIVNTKDEVSGEPSKDSKEEKQASATSKTPSSASPKRDAHSENVTYTEDGSAIYTDPATKFKYKWCTQTNSWTPWDTQSNTATSSDPYENEHYKWCGETQKWIPKQTQSQVTETDHYKWDAEKQEWIAKQSSTATDQVQTVSADIVYDIDEDGQRIYTDKDGTVFFWDVEKNAWFPKIDDDFMARYQMSYGFIDNTTESENEKKRLEEKAAEMKEQELQRMTEEARKSSEDADSKTPSGGAVKRKAPPEPPKWFDIDPEHNTKVYVSNLPLDITLDEFAEVMGKCGMIMRDPQTQKFKLKLYAEADGQLKGDGLCDYIKVESVNLALKILDEYILRGHKIRVQPAKFQMRGEYNPALKPKRKKKDKEKLAKIKEKLFDWRPEKMRGERSKNEKTVIIKNLFHPELFEKEVQLILDYQNDLREECSKCGTVRKVVIYDRHSEGVAQINMSSPEEADLVIQMMHGRFFGKRQLTAEHWDGKTKYKIEETEEEIQKRLNKWDNYLETDKSETQAKTTEPSSSSTAIEEEKNASEECSTFDKEAK